MRDLERARRRRRGARRARPSAVPGLVDCHTHPALGGDRVEEFSLRAAGATLRGAPRCGRRHPLDRRRDARARARTGCVARVELHAGVDARARHDDLGRQVRLRARPRHRAGVAARGSRRGRVADVARRPRRAARVRRTPTRISTSRSPRCCRRRRGSPRRRTSSSSAARSTRAGAPVSDACSERGARAAAARRPVHGERRDPARRSSSAPGRSTTSRRPALRARCARRRASRHGVLLPASALFLGPADAAGACARRRGRRDRPRDRLRSRQRPSRPACRCLHARLHTDAGSHRPRR